MFQEAADVRVRMKALGLKKISSITTITIGVVTHIFHMNERDHPAMPEILQKWEELEAMLIDAGFKHDTSFVLQDLSEFEKVKKLCKHSEKLALCFAILNTSPDEPIVMTNNLRMCGDCHNATAFLSRLLKREIRICDSRRWHHFNDGVCTCGGYY